MNRTFRTLVLAFTLALVPVGGGCAALISSLPTVIAAVTDAVQILDAIENFVHAYYAAKPDPVREAACNAGIAKARSALNVALRLSSATENLDQKKLDDAFSDFRVAYQELLVLVAPIGVRGAPVGNLSATPNGLTVPEPLAMHLKVK